MDEKIYWLYDIASNNNNIITLKNHNHLLQSQCHLVYCQTNIYFKGS